MQIFIIFPIILICLSILRFWIDPEDYFDPTLPFFISKNDFQFVAIKFISLYSIISIPIIIILKKLKIPILKLSLNGAINIVKKNRKLIILGTTTYPLWAISDYFFGDTSIITKLAVLCTQFFSGSFLFVPFLKKRELIFTISIYLISLYPAFVKGNRTCSAFPVALTIIGYFLKYLYETKNPFSIKKLNLRFLRNLIISGFLTFFLSFSFFIIRSNRALEFVNPAALISSGALFQNSSLINVFRVSLVNQIDRLIQWPFYVGLLENSYYGLQGIFKEFFYVFSSNRHDINYMYENIVAKGIFQYIGVINTPGYSWPLTPIVEGSIRYNFLGSVIFYFILLFITIIFMSLVFVENKNNKINFLVLCYLLNTFIVSIQSNSIYQSFKSSLYFVIMISAFRLFLKFNTNNYSRLNKY